MSPNVRCETEKGSRRLKVDLFALDENLDEDDEEEEEGGEGTPLLPSEFSGYTRCTCQDMVTH